MKDIKLVQTFSKKRNHINEDTPFLLRRAEQIIDNNLYKTNTLRFPQAKSGMS